MKTKDTETTRIQFFPISLDQIPNGNKEEKNRKQNSAFVNEAAQNNSLTAQFFGWFFHLDFIFCLFATSNRIHFVVSIRLKAAVSHQTDLAYIHLPVSVA